MLITSWLFPTTIAVSAWRRTDVLITYKNLATPIQEFGYAISTSVRWSALIDIGVLGKYVRLDYNDGESPPNMLIKFFC